MPSRTLVRGFNNARVRSLLHPSVWLARSGARHPLTRLAEPSNFFRRPQFRAAGPRVAINLCLRRRHRLTREHVVDALRCAGAKRIFHLPVFQRMEADHHQPPFALEDSGRRVEQRPEVLEFMVYEDSDCLESFCRGMNSLMFH